MYSLPKEDIQYTPNVHLAHTYCTGGSQQQTLVEATEATLTIHGDKARPPCKHPLFPNTIHYNPISQPYPIKESIPKHDHTFPLNEGNPPCRPLTFCLLRPGGEELVLGCTQLSAVFCDWGFGPFPKFLLSSENTPQSPGPVKKLFSFSATLNIYSGCAFSGSFPLVPVDGAMEQKAGGLSRILCQCCGGLPSGWAVS